jgi:hypothetical protein
MNDAELELPDKWQDRTTYAFVDGSNPTPSLSLIITRDELKDGLELTDFAEAKLEELTLQLKAFRLIEKRQIQAANSIALEIEFRWRTEAGPVYQRQVYVQHGKRITVVTATASRQLDEVQNAEINDILLSLRFRD